MQAQCQHRGHGSSRSLVRMLASYLPLNGSAHLYVQLPSADSPLRSLSISDKQGLTAAMDTDLFSLPDDGEPGDDSAFEEWEVDGERGSTDQQEAASERISSLEGELARLRAEIAAYTLTEYQPQVPSAPAPPPPPSLPPTASSLPHTAAGDGVRGEGVEVEETPGRPNMAHVLQGIHNVQLRSAPVARSPGGTPARRTTADQTAAAGDPASIIAAALRKKFSSQVFPASPELTPQNCSHDSFSSSATETPVGKLQFD